MNTPTPKGTVTLYCCGGGGTNIGYEFEGRRNRPEVGFAEINPVYVDTSRSNLIAGIAPEHTYVFEGKDGSGQIRADNHLDIAASIGDVLQKHPPGDLSIVLSSAGGGSGSVIAPLITSELLGRGLAVIVIAIGSADTKRLAVNTLNTFKSYEGVSRTRKAPVVMRYFQNSPTTPREVVDVKVIETITLLCALFSRQNSELDTRDLFNFLNFHRVGSFQPQLVGLELEEADAERAVAWGNVITVATLARDKSSQTAYSSMIEYQVTGFLPEDADPSMQKHGPLHYVTYDGIVSERVKVLTELLKDLERTQSARIQKDSILSNDDAPTSSGLVL